MISTIVLRFPALPHDPEKGGMRMTFQSSSEYDGKPWLKTYPPWMPGMINPTDETVLDRFEKSAAAFPDDPCIYYFNTLLTYGKIRRMACALNAAMTKLGINSGDRILLWMQNIPQVAVATLAAWMRSAVVVPANPMYTEKDIHYLLDDCDARLIICQDDLYEPGLSDRAGVITTSPLDMLDPEEAPAGQLEHVHRKTFENVTDLLTLINIHKDTPCDIMKPTADTLAYLVYTSGTTGPPKGAMISHANIVYNACVYEKSVRLDRTDSVLGVAPLFHITGIVAHLAVSFHLGIPLVLFNRFDAVDALRLIEIYRITFTVASITVYIALLSHPESKNFDISSFTKAYSGGAPVSPGTVKKFRDALGLTIYNIYGLTESTSPATITPLDMTGPVDDESGALSVGLIVPGVEAWIVDVEDPDTPLPPGRAGELVLRGPCMTAGYWKKPEETAHAIKDGRFYTGDVAKIDNQGWCYIVDRKKDQINVSGFKVWPRDVEDVLYQHAAVKEAAVVGVPDPYRGETVKAFVALADGYSDTVTPEEIIAFCRERLAAFKYPRIVEIIDEVPKTATGKFLRRELRKRV
jgi:long-chain acyl-CoA synthetase